MNRNSSIRKVEKLALVAFAAALPSSSALATTTGLPWEGPLTTLKDSLTGPVALVISLVSILVCGGTLIFGGEIGDFSKRMIMVVLAIAVVVGGASILTTLFGFTAAVL